MEPTATPPFVAKATHSAGGRHRDGFLVLSPDVAGFVPTSDWRNTAAEIALGLFTTRIELSKPELKVVDSPDLPRELEAFTRERGGFLLDGEWTWTRMNILHVSYVMLNRGRQETLTCAVPPEALLARWRRLAPPTAKSKRVAGMILGGVAVLCAVAGTVAWRLSGESDYLVAGLFFAGLFTVVLGAVFYSLRRAH